MNKVAMNQTVAVIGSFKQYYNQVLSTIEAFRAEGIIVTSPTGADVMKPRIPFVRFTSDDPEFSDEMVQTITLKRIMSSAAVYVVNPYGYVGKTTSYEIGRIIQSRKPIYFLNEPDDLPIKIPSSHIIEPKKLAELILSNSLCWPYESAIGEIFAAERSLI